MIIIDDDGIKRYYQQSDSAISLLRIMELGFNTNS